MTIQALNSYTKTDNRLSVSQKSRTGQSQLSYISPHSQDRYFSTPRLHSHIVFDVVVCDDAAHLLDVLGQFLAEVLVGLQSSLGDLL